MSLPDADAAHADEVLAAAAPGLRLDQLSRKAAALEMKLNPEGVKARKDHAKGDPAAGRGPPRGLRQRLHRRPRARHRHRPGLQVLHRLARRPDPQLRSRRRRPGRDPRPRHDRAPPGPQSPPPAHTPPQARCRSRRRPDAARSRRTIPPSPPAGTPTTLGPTTQATPTTRPTTTTLLRRPGRNPRLDRRGSRKRPPGRARRPRGTARAAAYPHPDPPRPRPTSTSSSPSAPSLGWSTTPAQAGSFGLLDPDETRALVAAASQHPRSRWAVTLTDPVGREECDTDLIVVLVCLAR